MDRISGRRFRPLSCAGGAFLALVTMELIVHQIFYEAEAIQPGIGPVRAILWRNEGSGLSHWNSQGLRLNGQRVPGARQHPVLVIGNSFAAGEQVNDDDVFTAVLEQLLASKGISIPVLNRGHRGMTAADFVGLAADHLATFAPGWMVVLLEDRDLGSMSWTPKNNYFYFTRDARDNGLIVQPPVVAMPDLDWRNLPQPFANRLLKQFIGWHIMMVPYLYERARDWFHGQGAAPALFHAAVTVEAANDNAYPIEAELDLLAHVYHGRLTFLYLGDMDPLQPLAVTEGTELRFSAHCARRGWSCVNIRPYFPALAQQGLSPYGFANSGYNEGHMNEMGHKVAAQALAAELEKLHARGLF